MGKFVAHIIDDVLIYSKNVIEHKSHLNCMKTSLFAHIGDADPFDDITYDSFIAETSN